MQYKRPTFPTMHQGYIIYNKDGQSDFFLFGFKPAFTFFSHPA